MRVWLIILLLLTSGLPAGACLWSYDTDLHGRIHLNDEPPDLYMMSLSLTRGDTNFWQERVAKLRETLPGDFKIQNDLAVALIHLGKTDEALELLLQIEASHSGEYEVASNLGTAYELSGDREQALLWIAEGLKRNPDSHHGSEWIHLRILEVKELIEDDPDWLATHSILPAELGPENPIQRISHLEYQLHERLSLVKKPNPIVAALLVELGDLQGENKSADLALAIYELALEYQPVNELAVKQRMADAQRVIWSRSWLIIPINAITSPLFWMLTLVALFFLGISIWITRWLRKRRTRTNSRT